MCLLKCSHAKWIDGETVIYERRWATNQMNVNTEYWWILLLIFRHLALSESCLPMPNSMFQSWGDMGDCQDVNGYSGWFLKHSSVVTSMVFKEGSRWELTGPLKNKNTPNHLKFLFKSLQCDSDSNSYGHISDNLSFVHELLYKWLYWTVVVNRFSIDCSGMDVWMDGWWNGQ